MPTQCYSIVDLLYYITNRFAFIVSRSCYKIGADYPVERNHLSIYDANYEPRTPQSSFPNRRGSVV